MGIEKKRITVEEIESALATKWFIENCAQTIHAGMAEIDGKDKEFWNKGVLSYYRNRAELYVENE